MKPQTSFLDLPTTRRGFLAGAVSASAMVALAACAPSGSGSGGSGGSGTVSVMSNNSADWDKQMAALVQTFQKDHKGITIKVLNIADGEQYGTKLKTQALARALPDIYYTRSFDIAPQVRDGWLAPLDDMNSKSGDPLGRKKFYPGVEAQFSIKDKLYAAPEGLAAYGVYVNKTMFAAEGIPLPKENWTWDDFYELAGAFIKKDGDRQTRWGGYVNPSSWGLIGVMMANGGRAFDASGKCVVADKANLATFEPMRKAVVSGAIPGPGGLPEGVDPFAGGLLPMYMNGSWYAAGAKAAIADKFEWTILPLPKGSTGKRELATAGGGWSISSQAKNPEQAWEFLSYLGSAKGLATLPYAASVPLTARTTDTFSDTTFPKVGADAAAIAYPVRWSAYETSWGNRFTGLFTSDDALGTLKLIQEETNR